MFTHECLTEHLRAFVCYVETLRCLVFKVHVIQRGADSEQAAQTGSLGWNWLVAAAATRISQALSGF